METQQKIVKRIRIILVIIGISFISLPQVLFNRTYFMIVATWGFFCDLPSISLSPESALMTYFASSLILTYFPLALILISSFLVSKKIRDRSSILVKTFMVPLCACLILFLIAIAFIFIFSSMNPPILISSFVNGPAVILILVYLARNRVGPWILPPITLDISMSLKPRYRFEIEFLTTLTRLLIGGKLSVEELAKTSFTTSAKIVKHLSRLCSNHLISGSFNPSKTEFQLVKVNLPFNLNLKLPGLEEAPVNPRNDQAIENVKLDVNTYAKNIQTRKKQKSTSKTSNTTPMMISQYRVLRIAQMTALLAVLSLLLLPLQYSYMYSDSLNWSMVLQFLWGGTNQGMGSTFESYHYVYSLPNFYLLPQLVAAVPVCVTGFSLVISIIAEQKRKPVPASLLITPLSLFLVMALILVLVGLITSFQGNLTYTFTTNLFISAYIFGPISAIGLAFVVNGRVGPWILPPTTLDEAKTLNARHKQVVDFVFTLSRMAASGPIKMVDFAGNMKLKIGVVITKINRFTNTHLIEGMFNDVRSEFKLVNVRLPFLPAIPVGTYRSEQACLVREKFNKAMKGYLLFYALIILSIPTFFDAKYTGGIFMYFTFLFSLTTGFGSRPPEYLLTNMAPALVSILVFISLTREREIKVKRVKNMFMLGIIGMIASLVMTVGYIVMGSFAFSPAHLGGGLISIFGYYAIQHRWKIHDVSSSKFETLGETHVSSLPAPIADNQVMPIKEANDITTQPSLPLEIKQQAISITRGFEVAGDCFKFFIRLQNDYAAIINDATVRIRVPQTLQLDVKKSPSIETKLGMIPPGKHATAIYFLYCIACADATINASVEYFDPLGELQTARMEPFQVTSCKYVKPRVITKQQFDIKRQQEEGKELVIPVKADQGSDAIIDFVRQRVSMSTVSESSGKIDLFGETRDGKDIGMSLLVREIPGIKSLVATVFGQNQSVLMGMLSEVMEGLKDVKMDTTAISRQLDKLLANQISQHEALAKSIETISARLKEMSAKVADLESQGDAAQADELNKQVTAMREEMRGLFANQENLIGSIASSIDTVSRNHADAVDRAFANESGGDWDRVKQSWQEYKDGKRSMKELLASAAKELGKRLGKAALKKIVSILTGGLVEF